MRDFLQSQRIHCLQNLTGKDKRKRKKHMNV